MERGAIVPQLRLLDMTQHTKTITSITTSMSQLTDMVKDMREHGLDEHVKELEDLHRKYAGMQFKLNAQKTSVEQVKAAALRSNSLADLDTQYKQVYAQELKKQPAEETMAASSSSTSTQLEQDGIVVEAATENLTCPITQQEMVDPVMNSACKHSYDKTAIHTHIKNMRGNAVRCPISGCTRSVHVTNLVPNTKLIAILQNQRRS